MTARYRTPLARLAVVVSICFPHAVVAAPPPVVEKEPAEREASKEDAANKEAPNRDAATVAAARFFKQHDRDGDGALSRAEFPERARQLFERIDADRDGRVTRAEDIAFRRALRRGPGKAGRAPRLPDGFVAHRDLTYAERDDGPLRLDIYAPRKSVAPRPLVVWVHGGGWRQGSKNRCPALRLLEQGFVVASIDYRLTDRAVFPAQIEDCKAALRWLRAHAAEYQIDPQRVGVWGSSAGGHLVALLGTSGDVAELEGRGPHKGTSSRVQAVCDFFGPTDLLQMDAHALPGAPFKHDGKDSPEAKLVGGPIQEHPEKAARANPITYVTPDDPPFLIVHGDRDPLVPLHQSELLEAALRKAGVPVTLHKVEGAGHGFGGRPEIDRMVDKFFREQLKPAAAAQPADAK